MRNSPLRVLLVSIVPPQNDCGVRIVMHRHLVERVPFLLKVATSYTDAVNPELDLIRLKMPWLLERVKKSRWGPRLRRWLTVYENLVQPWLGSRALEALVDDFRPDVMLTLAETGWCHVAASVAEKRGIPLVGLFLDWFPDMEPHFGFNWCRPQLSRRFKDLYGRCDFAVCTSDGMQEMLGPHPNSVVVYPMPGRHAVPARVERGTNSKFRIAYVGAAWGFYGRMLFSLRRQLAGSEKVELVIIAPYLEWPETEVEQARTEGVYLGFKPPAEAAPYLAGADALLVVMSFEREHERFMRTSFTTKFLDYCAFGKPIILWGPDYCTPARVVQRDGGALWVSDSDPASLENALQRMAADPELQAKYRAEAENLHHGLFDPARLQGVLVRGIESLVPGHDAGGPSGEKALGPALG